jgi:serine/threonine-protein kinase RsbW
MEYNHPTVSVDVRLRAQHRAIADAIGHARDFIRRADCGPDAEARLCIIVEELIANIIEHGGAAAESEIALRIDAIGADIGLTLSDAGIPFDPRRAHVPGEAPPDRGGGAGVALILSWAAQVDYARVDGRNVLTLVIPAHG